MLALYNLFKFKCNRTPWKSESKGHIYDRLESLFSFSNSQSGSELNIVQVIFFALLSEKMNLTDIMAAAQTYSAWIQSWITNMLILRICLREWTVKIVYRKKKPKPNKKKNPRAFARLGSFQPGNFSHTILAYVLGKVADKRPTIYSLRSLSCRYSHRPQIWTGVGKGKNE